MIRLSLLCAAAALALPAQAQDDHGHEHGAADLTVLLGEGEMRMTLRLAGDNLFGHTEAGHDASHDSHSAEHDLEDARGYLETVSDFVTFPDAAGCEMSEMTVLQQTIEGGDHDGHSDFEATYFFTCARPDALTTLTATAFQRDVESELEAIQATIIANGEGRTVELTPDAPEAEFPVAPAEG